MVAMPRLVSARTLDELHWASMTLAAGAQSMLGGNGGSVGEGVSEATLEQYPGVTARDMVAMAVALEVAHGLLVGRLQRRGLSDLMGTVMSSFEVTWDGMRREAGGDDAPEA